MKELLHRGTQADLNIYVTTLNNGGIIGCGLAPQHILHHLQTLRMLVTVLPFKTNL